MAHCLICKGEIVTKQNDVCSACQSMFNEAVVSYHGHYRVGIADWIELKLRCTDGVTRLLEFDTTDMRIKPASGDT